MELCGVADYIRLCVAMRIGNKWRESHSEEKNADTTHDSETPTGALGVYTQNSTAFSTAILIFSHGDAQFSPRDWRIVPGLILIHQ